MEARRTLNIPSQGKLGTLLGSSERSGQRWERADARPTNEQLHNLAALVYPHNRALAAEIAEVSGTTLLALGIEVPPPPAPPLPPPGRPPAPPPDPVYVVDTIVCAAAEAMGVVPGAIRPALRAAFRRAARVRLSVEVIDAALNAEPREEQPAKVAQRLSDQPGAGALPVDDVDRLPERV
jgi:hypothetical protein